MKPQSLLSAIRQLGGVNIREIADLTGEHRTGRGGFGPGVFRRPSAGKRSGLKATGFGLDELCVRLRDMGFLIADDPVDGGVAELRDMIRAEIDGGKSYSALTAEDAWQAERERIERSYEDNYTAPALPRFLVQPSDIPNRWMVYDYAQARPCPTIAAGMTLAVASLYAERLNAKEEIRT